MSILANKAQAITQVLLDNGLVQQAHSRLVEREVLDALKEGGCYQFLEGDHAIQVKTIVRDSNGQVLARQG